MIHYTSSDAKGLNSLRAEDSRSGCIDTYFLLTFFLFAITRDLTFSPVRQLQLWRGEAGSTCSACFNSTVFCIWLQLQQSWIRKNIPTSLTTSLSQPWPSSHKVRKVLTNIIVEIFWVKFLMHNVALYLKPLFIFLGSCSGCPTQYNFQLTWAKAEEQESFCSCVN